jgi:hypothetical protein
VTIRRQKASETREEALRVSSFKSRMSAIQNTLSEMKEKVPRHPQKQCDQSHKKIGVYPEVATDRA